MNALPIGRHKGPLDRALLCYYSSEHLSAMCEKMAYISQKTMPLNCINGIVSIWWRWWESNPRPKTVPQGFLRVQLLF